jgi:hypothetical protein
MRIDSLVPGQQAARDVAPPPSVAARVLAGDVTNLTAGQQAAGTVLRTQGTATLLEVLGQQLLVEGLPRLPAGSPVAVTLQSLVPAPVLEVSPGLRSAVSPLQPEVGQEMIARVLQQLPNGHTLINVKGVPLDATAPPGLQPGTELTLRVAQIQPQVVFHIVENAPSVETQAAQIIRANYAERVPLADSLVVLRQALAAVTAPENVEPPPVSVAHLQTVLDHLLPEQPATAQEVAAFVRDGGLQLETKLAQVSRDGPAAAARVLDGDVKGLVLRALRDVDAAATSSPQVQTLGAALTQHLSHIETQQALNLLAHLHGEALQLQFPVYAGQGLTTAFLSIEPDGSDSGGAGGKAGGRSGFSVLFLLDLDNLGRTRIDARFSGPSPRVVFYLDGEESLQNVRAELPAFRQALQAQGYQDVLLAARPLTEMAADRRQKAEALALGVPAGVHLVDVRA